MPSAREANLNAKGYSERDERRILDALGRGLLKEFPNPERVGCPGSDVLRRIASKEMALSEAEKWLNHLGSCSPCYAECKRLQQAYDSRRRRFLLAAAAAILVAVAVAGWALLLQRNGNLTAQTAVLDLRDRSPSRGTEVNPDESSVEVSRLAKQWDIRLPIGSDEGLYEVSILTNSGESVSATTGMAKLQGNEIVLHVGVNVSSVNAGLYVLKIGKVGAGRNTYPLLLR